MAQSVGSLQLNSRLQPKIRLQLHSRHWRQKHKIASPRERLLQPRISQNPVFLPL